MRLNKKFSLTVSLLALISIAIMSVMLVSLSAVIQINEYERNLLIEQNIFQEAMNYSDLIAARSVEIANVHKNWKSLTNSASEKIKEIKDSSARKYFTKDINEKIDALSELWNLLDKRFNAIDEIYLDLSNREVPNALKRTLSESGILPAIALNPDSDILKEIEFSIAKVKKTTQSMQTICDSFETMIMDISTEITALVSNVYRIFFILAISVTLVVSIGALLLATRITRRIVRRINELQDVTSKLAQKDFSMRINAAGNDEIFELSKDLDNTVGILNDFLITVKKTAADAETSGHSINESAVSTATATHQINDKTEALGKLVDKLSAAVTRSINATNQMIGTSKTLLEDNTRQTNAIITTQKTMNNMANDLGTIAQMAEERTASAKNIQQLVENGDEKIYSTYSLLQDVNNQLDEIAEIVDIINDIAEQTNILSMNAAVESAHAGEAGKGFGVVAEEIRQLAESTADNAMRITSSLYAIISTVKDANITSKAAADAFQLVRTQTKDMIVSLSEITENIHGIDSNMQQITGQNTALSDASIKITDSCDKLSAQQSLVSNEMNSMSNIFHEVQSGIKKIKTETGDIVTKMIDINTKSMETCAKMEKLDTTLAKFTTVDITLHGLDDLYDQDELATPSITSTIVPISNESESDDGMTEISADDFFS